MPAMADVSSGCSAFIGFLIQGLFICVIVFLISRRRRRSSTRQAAVSYIANQWPDDEEYLKKLCTPILAVPFKEGVYTCYATTIKGRKIFFRYWHDTDPKVLQISLAVTQKFWLRMLPQSGDDLPDELRIQDKLLDAKYRIHSDQQQIALRFMNSPKTIKEFWSLHEFNSFEINKGDATYVLNNPRDTGFLHHAFEQSLKNLNNILDIYEKQKLDLFIEVLQSESNICPYCREDLDPHQERIVKCNLCQTQHHESCLKENQQCTTWGCRATESDFTVMVHGSRTSGQQFETN